MTIDYDAKYEGKWKDLLLEGKGALVSCLAGFLTTFFCGLYFFLIKKDGGSGDWVLGGLCLLFSALFLLSAFVWLFSGGCNPGIKSFSMTLSLEERRYKVVGQGKNGPFEKEGPLEVLTEGPRFFEIGSKKERWKIPESTLSENDKSLLKAYLTDKE